MVIRYVSCQALVDPGSTAFIHFIVDGLVDDDNAVVLSMIPTAESVFSSVQHRIAATETTEIYLGVDNNHSPTAGTEIEMFAQRGSTIASGLLSCVLSGVIDPDL